MNEIKPYIISINTLDTVGDTENASDRWAVDLGVMIGDKATADQYASLSKIKKWIAKHSVNEFTGRTDGLLGRPLPFLVCSKSYASIPDANLHSQHDVEKALIQEHYDESAARERITDIVDGCPAGSIEAVEEYLGAHFDMEPWLND